MSDYTQIGNLVADDLAIQEQRDWLESLSDDMNRCFVEVTDGDASCARVVDISEILTIDELLESDYAAASYVAVDKNLTDESDIEKIEAVRNRASAKLGFSIVYFCPIED